MPEQMAHPNEKPVALMTSLLFSLTQLGQVVLDPFVGVGASAVAAKRMGRCFVGIDISEEYCEISRQRLRAVDTGVPVKEQRQGQKALFDDDSVDTCEPKLPTKRPTEPQEAAGGTRG